MIESICLSLVSYTLVFMAGALLGAFFFGGLWWTVRKGLASEWPAVWFLGSLLVRTSIILAGFLLVSQGHWLRLVICFFGFLVSRYFIVTRISAKERGLEMESHRASQP